MALAVEPVVIILGVEDSGLLLGEVAAELDAQAKRLNHAPPVAVGGVGTAVFPVADYLGKLVAIPRVARSLYGGYDIETAAVVTLYGVFAQTETAVAGECGIQVDDALVEAHKRVDGLECAARRIAGHQCAVVHRLVLVPVERRIVDGHIGAHQQIGVVARRRYQRQHLARLGLYGHYGACLVLHEFLAIHLEVDIESGGDITAHHRHGIVFAVLVFALDAVFHIHHVDFGSLLTA